MLKNNFGVLFNGPSVYTVLLLFCCW